MTKQVVLSKNEYNELIDIILAINSILGRMRNTQNRRLIESKIDDALKILEGEDMELAKLKEHVHALELRPTYPY
jgi:hypothetical protein